MLKTLLCLFLLSTAAVCTAQSAEVLKEKGLRKLEVFAGTWKTQGDPDSSKHTPVSALTTCRWSVNGKFLVCDQLVTADGAQTDNLSIYSYNPDMDVYTLSLVGVPGMDPFALQVSYRGDTLIYSSRHAEDGKTIYDRTLNIFASPSAYIYQQQSSGDGLHWQTTASGRSIKIAPAPAP